MDGYDQEQNITSHTYQEKIAAEIARKIQTTYDHEFLRLQERLEVLSKEAP